MASSNTASLNRSAFARHRAESNGDARFVTMRRPLQDESDGSNDQEIEFRQLNVRLLLSTQDLSGYELLPIAQIERSGDKESVPRLNREYIPPVTSIDAWPGLGRDIVRAIYDIVGRKIEVLSRQIVNRGVGLDSRHPGDLDRVLMLSELNEAYSVLAVLAFAQGVHPLTAYTELCRIVGRLSILGPERRAADIPAYDHEDLGRIFREVKERIERLIDSVRDYQFQQRFFVGVGMGMQVSLEPRWFHSDWEWFIGVRKGDLTYQECLDLLSPGQLDWKLGSSRQVEILFQRRAEGVQLTPLDRPIRVLPSSQDWLFFEVPRRDHPAWRDVQETQTLAMRLKDSLILNHDRLQGERQLVVNARGKRATLEFALFAVPIET
jgi:type VI secretion system protein ImpJ